MSQREFSPEAVEEDLNILERLTQGASSADEYLEAILKSNIYLANIINSLHPEAQGQNFSASAADGYVNGVPDKTVGIAATEVEQGDTGQMVFQLDGRNVSFVMRAENDIESGEVVVVENSVNGVVPIDDVDETAIGLGSIKTSSLTASNYGVRESPQPVSVNPGEAKTVFDEDFGTPISWWEIGMSDASDAIYQYYVDGESLFETPILEPLGLYNNMYKFPQPLKVMDNIRIVVQLSDQAGAPVDFVTKVTYVQGQ